MKKFNYYDRIAQIYDQTRWLTESVAEETAATLVTSDLPGYSTCHQGRVIIKLKQHL